MDFPSRFEILLHPLAKSHDPYRVVIKSKHQLLIAESRKHRLPLGVIPV